MKAWHFWLAIWFGAGVVCPFVRGATEPGILGLSQWLKICHSGSQKIVLLE
jgi:hypothetical protein